MKRLSRLSTEICQSIEDLYDKGFDPEYIAYLLGVRPSSVHRNLSRILDRRDKVQQVRNLAIATARAFEIPEAIMFGDVRARWVARPRQFVAYVAYMEWGYSTPVIAAGLNRRDHTTIIHAIKLVRPHNQTRQVCRVRDMARRIHLFQEAA